VPLGHDPALLVGMDQRDDSRDEERGLDVVTLEQIEDARHPDPRAVLALRELAGRHRPHAQRGGLVLWIERQRHADARPVLPALRAERPPRPYLLDSPTPPRLFPRPGRIVLYAHGA